MPGGVEPTAEDGYALRAPGPVQPLVTSGWTGQGASCRCADPGSRRVLQGSRHGEKFTDDGWLRTGDVAQLRHGSYIKLVDRTKDLVKSGGEWISSVELENEIMAHPDVLEAAVIAVPDARWGSGPAPVWSARGGLVLDGGDCWTTWAPRREVVDPESVEFLEEVPKTSVGKFDKKVLRARCVVSATSVDSRSA